jgi:predicted transcriptional regulator
VTTRIEASPLVGSDQQLALLAKALGHPARVRIIRLLLARDACYCGGLVDELPLAQATVSQHLKVLRDAGFIVGEIEGYASTTASAATGLPSCTRSSPSCSTRP